MFQNFILVGRHGEADGIETPYNGTGYHSKFPNFCSVPGSQKIWFLFADHPDADGIETPAGDIFYHPHRHADGSYASEGTFYGVAAVGVGFALIAAYGLRRKRPDSLAYEDLDVDL